MMKGDLLMDVAEVNAAEPWYRDAYETAAQAGATMSQLLAATRLARLHRPTGESPDRARPCGPSASP